VIQSQWAKSGIVLHEVESKDLEQGWVRLRVEAAGICGSDLNRLRSKQGAGETPGHEVAGSVLQSSISMPDAIFAVDPWIICGRCEFCVAGRSEQCSNGRAIGIDVAGGLAETIDVPAANLHPVSSELSSLQASLAEPFAVCTRAIHLCNLKLDSHVLILGAGSLGLISGLLARDRAGRVSITTMHDYQRDLATRMGLEPVAVADLEQWSRDNAPDIVIEAVGGYADTLQQAMQVCRPTGRIVMIGMFLEPVQINGEQLLSKGLTMVGSRLYGQTGRSSEVAAAANVLPRYKSELGLLQTHQFPLSEIETAIATAGTPDQRPIKVTVLP
jgi:L-iditol 2-dehydrogenase